MRLGSRGGTHAHRPWPTSSACGPFTRRNVAGFDSGTSSMTPSSLLANQKQRTEGHVEQHPRFSTWHAVGWEVRNCCACAATTQIGVAFSTLIQAARLPRPSNPQVRSSQMPVQRSGHTCWAPEFTFKVHDLPRELEMRVNIDQNFKTKCFQPFSLNISLITNL